MSNDRMRLLRSIKPQILNEIRQMTYGRSRLWMGITGVGCIVVIAALSLAFGLPQRLFENEPGLATRPFLQLVLLMSLIMIWQAPFDLLGGYLLPKKFGRNDKPFSEWLRTYIPAASLQAVLFVVFGSLIVVLGHRFGTPGGILGISLLMIACFVGRNRLMLLKESHSKASSEKLLDAVAKIQSWEIFVPRTVVVDHSDAGFTGGVIGFRKNVKIIIPKSWLSFAPDELAAAIARRALAVTSGSYLRGLVFAFTWNLGGFSLCTLLHGAGLSSIAGLVTTLCGFTVWSFLGLLVLPTISRNASLKIDQELVHRGMPKRLLSQTASAMDQLQDDEPDRSRMIETIFHPVPSVASRDGSGRSEGFEAWNVARTTLFLSWACLGFLSRSVHCNVGRPELWIMLPTD